MNIQIIRNDVVGSTNDEALSHARLGAQEGLCVVASSQTNGRGRQGRYWSSEKDAGLYVSILLRPDIEPRSLPVLTLLCAIAVHDSVQQLTGRKPDIKWPNDILVDEKKISGILLETCETNQGTAVVVGIGLNLRSDLMPAGVRVISTSINEVSEKERSFNDCLESITHNIAARYDDFSFTKDPTRILSEWSARSSFARGKMVCATMRHTQFYGETIGLDQTGALVIRAETTGQVVAVTSGDVMSMRADDRSEEEKKLSAEESGADVNSDQICDDEGIINVDQVQ